MSIWIKEFSNHVLFFHRGKTKDVRDPICEYLLQKGFNINQDAGKFLKSAFGKRNKPMVILFLEHGANPNADPQLMASAIDVGGKQLVEKMVQYGGDVFQTIGDRRTKSYTCLHKAGMRGDVELFKYLLHKGLDLNAKDANGKTPVQVATTEIRQYVRSLDLGDKYVVFRCSVDTPGSLFSLLPVDVLKTIADTMFHLTIPFCHLNLLTCGRLEWITFIEESYPREFLSYLLYCTSRLPKTTRGENVDDPTYIHNYKICINPKIILSLWQCNEDAYKKFFIRWRLEEDEPNSEHEVVIAYREAYWGCHGGGYPADYKIEGKEHFNALCSVLHMPDHQPAIYFLVALYCLSLGSSTSSESRELGSPGHFLNLWMFITLNKQNWLDEQIDFYKNTIKRSVLPPPTALLSTPKGRRNRNGKSSSEGAGRTKEGGIST